MVLLKITDTQIIDEMDIERLLDLKAAKGNKEISLGLLAIYYFLAQDWYIGGITLNHLRKSFRQHLHLIRPALDFMQKMARTRKFIMKIAKENKIRFVDA